MFATIYDPATGRISTSVECDTAVDYAALIGDGQLVVDQPGSVDFHYVRDGLVVFRPRVAEDQYVVSANGSDTVEFAVPAGTEIRFDGETHTIVDGVFQFRTSRPKVYSFLLIPPFPAQIQLVEILAHAV